MARMNSNPTWLACAMLAIALCAAVSAPAASARSTTPVQASAPPPQAGNGRCINDEGADPKNAPTFRTVPATAGAQSAAADSVAPRMNLLAMVRNAGDPLVLGYVLAHYGCLLCLDGDADRARTLHEEMLPVARSIGDQNLRAEAHYDLAVDALSAGDVT